MPAVRIRALWLSRAWSRAPPTARGGTRAALLVAAARRRGRPTMPLYPSLEVAPLPPGLAPGTAGTNVVMGAWCNQVT